MSEQAHIFERAMQDKDKPTLGGRLPWMFELQAKLSELLAAKGKGAIGTDHSLQDLRLDFSQSPRVHSSHTVQWEEALQGQALAIMMESAELMDWTNWKPWKHGGQLNTEKLRAEMAIETIDILHFLVNMWILLGLNWDDVARIFAAKNAENHRRVRENY